MGYRYRIVACMGLAAKIACLLLLSAFAFSYSAFAANIRFVGNVGYSLSGSVATLTADRVENDDSGGMSGTLRMELWAFSTPFGGGSETGYRLATYRLGQLNGGFGFPNVNSGAVAFAPPPDGVWFFAMLVTEFTGGSLDDGFTTRDFVDFADTVTIGPPPPPPPPSVPPSALENPQPGSFQSGIGLISGWSCAGPTAVNIDGTLVQAPYGGPRADTTSICGGANNGFGLLLNYNDFGPGTHSAQLFVNGSPRGSPVFFTVTVPSGEFMRGLSRTVIVPDFPSPGRTTTLVWQESQQNFAIQSVVP